jgi:predicted nucleic acid-binding protein
MQEYAELLARPKFSFDLDAIAAALAMFRDNGELVVPRTVAQDSPDPDDVKIMHCAETAQAE